MNIKRDFDVLIIGSGAAGLSLAIHLSKYCRVALLSKNFVQEGATLYAQGGIASVLNAKDSIEDHITDTINVGAGLCDPNIVRFTVEQGPKCIQWLIDKGVKFTQVLNNKKHYHLTQESGHSYKRIIHVEDATGKAVEETLISLVKTNPNITIFEFHMVVDLIIQRGLCVGAYVYDEKQDKVNVFRSKATVLATGGASRVYLYSSNPAVASGDGIAIGWRAGCRVCNMEFNQFHPTCLYHPAARSFLISETLRGEGAYLLLPNGKRFMHKYDSNLELAPRDVVARAIDHEMKRLGIRHVLLDISHKPAKFIKRRFPTIYERCLEYGFDITKQPIPVVPAAHYTCGGVQVDLNGRTNISNLYAIGEVSYTGLHGANRLPSNSLLECLVFAESASKDLIQNLKKWHYAKKIPSWNESWVKDSNEEVFVLHNWEEIRHFMWDYVGIVRSNKRLQRAAHRIALLKKEIQEYYGNFRVNKNLLELRNLIIVADLIVRSAQRRKESRGLHYTLDYPKEAPGKPKNTILKK
ncbi:MAG: L-aspartate oxidase [Coxiella sp. DG_40]|nr:MAG: L-aspartate oxidase [Coxiella sp. DG_40]